MRKLPRNILLSQQSRARRCWPPQLEPWQKRLRRKPVQPLPHCLSSLIPREAWLVGPRMRQSTVELRAAPRLPAWQAQKLSQPLSTLHCG
jgi:hypothetical protein